MHELVDAEEAAERCDSINAFERILARDRTTIVKVFLHVSKDVQAERVRECLQDPSKLHEFAAADVLDREKWSDYDRAYSDAISTTSTECAAWFAVGADEREPARRAVAAILVEALEALDPQFPPLDPEELEEAGISGPEDV